MIIATLPSRTLGISFAYPPQILSPSKLTQCKLWEVKSVRKFSGLSFSKKDATLLLIGTAYCSPSDHFSKEEGRKAALAHAIESLNLSKSERQIVWEAYWDRGMIKVDEKVIVH